MMTLTVAVLISGLAICLAEPQVIQTFPEESSSSDYLPPVLGGTPTTGFQTLPGQTTYTGGWTRPSFPPGYSDSTYVGSSVQILPDSTSSMTKPWTSTWTKPWSAGQMTKPWPVAKVSTLPVAQYQYPSAPVYSSAQSSPCSTRKVLGSGQRYGHGQISSSPCGSSTTQYGTVGGGSSTTQYGTVGGGSSTTQYGTVGGGSSTTQYGTVGGSSTTQYGTVSGGCSGRFGTIVGSLMPSCGRGVSGTWNTGASYRKKYFSGSPVLSSGVAGAVTYGGGQQYYSSGVSGVGQQYYTGSPAMSAQQTSQDCGSCGK